MDCRRDNGKDLAGTTWQCAGHVRAERDWLRAKLANVMCEWEHDVEVLTKERNAALKLSEQRGAAYDMTWREVESLRERLDKSDEERGRQYGLRLEIADEFAGKVAFLRELLVAVIKTGTKDPLLDARLTEELRGRSPAPGAKERDE
jgi:hypothetical protein